MHMYIHLYIRIYICMRTLAPGLTLLSYLYIYIYTYIYIHTCIHAYMHTHIYLYIQTYIYIQMYAYLGPFALFVLQLANRTRRFRPQVTLLGLDFVVYYMYMCVCIYRYIYTHTDTYIYKYKCAPWPSRAAHFSTLGSHPPFPSSNGSSQPRFCGSAQRGRQHHGSQASFHAPDCS